MERMTDDAAKKRRELEHELTLTMTAQVSYMKLIVLVMSALLCVAIHGWVWSHTGLGSFLCSLQVSPNFNCKLLEPLEVFQFFIYVFKQFMSGLQEALIQCCCMIKSVGKHALDTELIQSNNCEPSEIQVAK